MRSRENAENPFSQESPSNLYTVTSVAQGMLILLVEASTSLRLLMITPDMSQRISQRTSLKCYQST